LGRHSEAASLLECRNFHPWEGGEGKVSGQHIITYVGLAKKAIANEDYAQAIQFLKKAEVYPQNLGEGKLYGARENDIHFWLGCAYKGINDHQQALHYFELAANGDTEPAPAIFYNDQSPDKIAYQAFALLKLGQEQEATTRLKRLVSYADEHMNDEVKIDYFAVSLPDLVIFDDDLDKRNKIHCLYMKGLGLLGLHQWDEAKICFETVLSLESGHQGAAIHLQLTGNKLFISAKSSELNGHGLNGVNGRSYQNAKQNRQAT
jgi:tetratricopeptide (TPR) repeat protein